MASQREDRFTAPFQRLRVDRGQHTSTAALDRPEGRLTDQDLVGRQAIARIGGIFQPQVYRLPGVVGVPERVKRAAAKLHNFMAIGIDDELNVTDAG